LRGTVVEELAAVHVKLHNELVDVAALQMERERGQENHLGGSPNTACGKNQLIFE
jgi:hypothetical protein